MTCPYPYSNRIESIESAWWSFRHDVRASQPALVIFGFSFRPLPGYIATSGRHEPPLDSDAQPPSPSQVQQQVHFRRRQTTGNHGARKTALPESDHLCNACSNVLTTVRRI
jgi:hypothetical protein